MFQNKSLFRMLLIKKMSSGHFFHEPENGRASLCPVDIFFMSLKTEKRVFVRGTFFSWAWKPKSEFLSGGHWFTILNTSLIYSQPIQLVIQRTVPRIILTTRIIKQNSSTNHSPFNRYKIGRINNKAKRPKMNRMVFSLFLFSYYTLIL